MRESCLYGSVRGDRGNPVPYRDNAMPGHARRHNQSLHRRIISGSSWIFGNHNSDGAYTPDDTLPSRRSVPGHALALNKNEADRSRATKTGHVDG